MNNSYNFLFANIEKPMYIAKKRSVEVDDYNNEIVTYSKPEYFGLFNYQPLTGDELMAYMSAYGETKNRLVRAYIPRWYINAFKEYDLAYLYRITPDDEDTYGANANYRVRTFAEQNTRIMVVFEEIIKEK